MAMIRFPFFSTQRRIAFFSDVALFVPLIRQTALAGVAIFTAACLSGCTFGGAPVAPQERISSTRWPVKSPSLPTQSAPGKAATGSTGTKSPSKKSTSPLQAWANALFHGSKNQTQTVSTSKAASASQPRVYIDVVALAQRHPAWRLAEQLAASKPETVDVAFPGALPRVGKANFQAPSRVSLAPNPVLDSRDNRVVPASNVALESRNVGAARRSVQEAPLQNRARQQSAAGLNQFLQAAAADQRATRRAQENEGRATLQDDLASREIALPALEPVGLPPSVQLEITNLRLKLLPNANTSALERAKAQAHLTSLQEIWKDKLRAQEEQLLQEWARQRDEEPRRLRREGEAQIVAQTQRAKNVDEARLAQLRDEQQRFLSGDFSAREALAVTLPPFSVYQIRGALTLPSANAASGWSSRIRLPETAPVGERVAQLSLASGSASVSLGVNAARAGALRTQALQDARGWAQTVARSRGWQLTERTAPGVPDQTRFALQNLGLL